MSNMKIPPEWAELFNMAKSIRPCAFDPTPHLVPGEVTEGKAPSMYLSLDAKRVWFHTYCTEKGVAGRIHCGEPTMNFDLAHSNGARIGFVYCNCDIIMDDVVVATATAGQAVFVDNLNELTMAIQNASGSAQSRALSNAGFGAASSTKLVTNDNPNTELPFTMGDEGKANADKGEKPVNKPAPVASDNNGATNTADAAPAATAEPAVTEHTVTAPAPASDLDELAKAKATVCRVRSRDWEGKSFGEILASPGGIKAIHYFMTSTRMGDANEAARNACKVIWDSLDPAVKASVK